MILLILAICVLFILLFMCSLFASLLSVWSFTSLLSGHGRSEREANFTELRDVTNWANRVFHQVLFIHNLLP